MLSKVEVLYLLGYGSASLRRNPKGCRCNPGWYVRTGGFECLSHPRKVVFLSKYIVVYVIARSEATKQSHVNVNLENFCYLDSFRMTNFMFNYELKRLLRRFAPCND